jgi:hypothetical protein
MSTFNEQYKSPHVEPAFGDDGADNDFFQRLAESMGEAITGPDAAQFTLALHEIFSWICAGKLEDKRSLKRMGMRVLAAAWVLDPGRFENQSLHQMAHAIGFGANNLAPLTADFARRFNVANKFQSHNWRKQT